MRCGAGGLAVLAERASRGQPRLQRDPRKPQRPPDPDDARDASLTAEAPGSPQRDLEQLSQIIRRQQLRHSIPLSSWWSLARSSNIFHSIGQIESLAKVSI